MRVLPRIFARSPSSRPGCAGASPRDGAFPFLSSRRPLVFAHRGGAALAPENTLAAFDNGLALGADGLELDVHLSRDGVVVVHHDRTLERTTNLHGPVTEWSAADLVGADAGHCYRRGDSYPFRGAGFGVPTLAQVLARYPTVPVIVELKVNSAELAHATIEILRAAKAVDRVCLGSFGLRVLRAARALEPAVPTSAAREEVRWALYRSWFRLAGLESAVRWISGPGVVGTHPRGLASLCCGCSRIPTRRPGLGRRDRN